jgi:alpha-galactosidase
MTQHLERDSVRADVSATRVSLRNERGTIAFDVARGQLVLTSESLSEPLIARLGVETQRGQLFATNAACRSTIEQSSVFADGVAIRCEQLELRWTLHANRSAFAIEVGAAAVSAPITRFVPCEAAIPVGSSSMLRLAYCGAHSRSPLSASSLVALDSSTNETSWWCSAFADERGQGIVIGFLSGRRFTGAVSVGGASFRAFNYGERVAPRDGETLMSEPLFIEMTDDAATTLESYATHVARVNGAVLSPRPPVFGWASWTHYGTDYDAATVLANADELARWFPGERPVAHIDHGWERRVKLHRPDISWEPRPEFSGDMAALIASLAAKNVRAGLWVVPFAINVGAPGTDAHLEHAVRGADGTPKLVGARQNYCIDPTHPDGERWLRELFGRFRGWGVSYFKLEYLRLLLCPEPFDADDGLDSVRRYDRARTRAEAYRYGLEVIRDAVGPDAYLVGCGAPALPGAGLVDAHRVGGDIERAWDHGDGTGVHASARNAAANFFWTAHAWRNDPDVLVAFDEENLLRFWTTAVALSGGTTLVSADLATLTERQRSAIHAAMPSLGASARPATTDRWELRIDDSQTVIGIFNGSDTEREIPIEINGDQIAWDFWNARPLETMSIRVGVHDAALIGVRGRKAHPQLVGSTMHYSMGALEVAECLWDFDRMTLAVRLTATRRTGTLAFRVPAPFRFVRASIPGAACDGETLRVPIDETTTRSFELHFREEP